MTAPLLEARKLKSAGDLEGATRVIEGALAAAPAEPVPLLRELAELRARRGQIRQAHEALDEARAAAKDNGDPSIEERRAWLYFREGKFAPARAICAELAATIKDDPALLGDVRNTLGGIAWQEGRIDDAMSEIAASIALYDAAHHAAGSAHSRLNLGVICFSRGDWQRARRYLVQSRRIRASAGLRQGLATNLLNLGLLDMVSGKLTQSRQWLEESAALCRAAGEPQDLILTEIALAHLDLLEQQIDSAAARLDAILSQRQSLTSDAHAQTLWLQSLVVLAKGESERAILLARDARRRAMASQVVETEADACRALGMAYRAEKRLPEAVEALETSAALARRANDPYRKALALFELSTVLHSRGDATSARSAADEAISTFKRLGARYDLTRAKFYRPDQLQKV